MKKKTATSIIKKKDNLKLEEVKTVEIDKVPFVDKNADLKIEESIAEVEELPQQEKSGIVLYIAGSIVAVLMMAIVILLSVIYFK